MERDHVTQTPVKWPQDDDRCYHGSRDEAGNARITVERPNTHKGDGEEIRVLQPADPMVEFEWDYLGSGPNAAATAILTDALGAEPEQRLYLAFAADFLAYCGREFRLRQGAVLRWARGWYAQRGLTGPDGLPEVLRNLPPVDRAGYDRRPTAKSPN